MERDLASNCICVRYPANNIYNNNRWFIELTAGTARINFRVDFPTVRTRRSITSRANNIKILKEVLPERFGDQISVCASKRNLSLGIFPLRSLQSFVRTNITLLFYGNQCNNSSLAVLQCASQTSSGNKSFIWLLARVPGLQRLHSYLKLDLMGVTMTLVAS